MIRNDSDPLPTAEGEGMMSSITIDGKKYSDDTIRFWMAQIDSLTKENNRLRGLAREMVQNVERMHLSDSNGPLPPGEFERATSRDIPGNDLWKDACEFVHHEKDCSGYSKEDKYCDCGAVAFLDKLETFCKTKITPAGKE